MKLDLVRCSNSFHKLSKSFSVSGGRNRSGRITVRHRGGGYKRTNKVVDIWRSIWNVPGIVLSIERNGFISARVALVAYTIGLLSYITAPFGLKIGDVIIAGWQVNAQQVGNAMPLFNIPLNTKIHNVEAYPGSGAVFARSAGTWATITEISPSYVKIILRSGLQKDLSPYCLGVIGKVGNINHRTAKFYKAGQARNRGIRPFVRGVAMNPVDHPHGGGKGKKSKNPVPQSPWGRLGKGQKTAKLRRTV